MDPQTRVQYNICAQYHERAKATLDDGDFANLGHAIMVLGEMYEGEGNYSMAQKCYQRAEKVFSSINDYAGAALALALEVTAYTAQAGGYDAR